MLECLRDSNTRSVATTLLGGHIHLQAFPASFSFFLTGGEASLVIKPLHTEEGSAEFIAHLP